MSGEFGVHWRVRDYRDSAVWKRVSTPIMVSNIFGSAVIRANVVIVGLFVGVREVARDDCTECLDGVDSEKATRGRHVCRSTADAVGHGGAESERFRQEASGSTAGRRRCALSARRSKVYNAPRDADRGCL